MKVRFLVLVLAAVSLLALGRSASAQAAGTTFTAHLSTSQEVQTPPVTGHAQGEAIFHLNSDGTELSYKLIVANINDVLFAHIHMAPAGENGAVVAFLYH